MNIRVKITEKCPWSCRFCHREGGWEIDDITWGSETRDAFMRLGAALGATEIHYTGGEPTCNRGLEKLNRGLSAMGFVVKTTTNGQFSTERLDTMMASGLTHFNFSVISLNPIDLKNTQQNMNMRRAIESIDRQKRNILRAVELNARVKINTVISTPLDIQRALCVYSFARRHGVEIRFLNDLNRGDESIRCIGMMIKNHIGAELFDIKDIPGSSSFTEYYRDPDGFIFGVKGIRHNRLEFLCEGCRENCTENFYGVRIEKRMDQFQVRLCIHRQDSKSVMPLDGFLQSAQIRELNEKLSRDKRLAA